MALLAERKVRIEFTPEPRTPFALVVPVGRVGRWHGTRFDLRDRGSAILCPYQRTEERHHRQPDHARHQLPHVIPPLATPELFRSCNTAIFSLMFGYTAAIVLVSVERCLTVRLAINYTRLQIEIQPVLMRGGKRPQARWGSRMPFSISS